MASGVERLHRGNGRGGSRKLEFDVQLRDLERCRYMHKHFGMAESEKEHLVYLLARVNEVLSLLPKKIREVETKRAVVRLQEAATSFKGIQYGDAPAIYEAIKVVQNECGVL